MADELDLASERETAEREYRIAEVRRQGDSCHPTLDCADCKGITQEHAKGSCEHFATCIYDWQKIERSKMIGGRRE